MYMVIIFNYYYFFLENARCESRSKTFLQFARGAEFAHTRTLINIMYIYLYIIYTKNKIKI